MNAQNLSRKFVQTFCTAAPVARLAVPAIVGSVDAGEDKPAAGVEVTNINRVILLSRAYSTFALRRALTVHLI